MVLTIVTGNVGTGKTLLATIFAAHSTTIVYANYNIKSKNYREFELDKFLANEYNNCMIILDEAYVYLESRIAMRHLNRVMSYLLFQSRKVGIDIILTAQLVSSLDVRYRDLCEYYIRCEENNFGFNYKITSIKRKITKGFSLPISKCGEYFKIFDTLQRINIVEDLSEVKELITPKERKMQEAEDYARQIIVKADMEGITRITHDVVDYYSQILNIPSYAQKLVYTCIKIEEKKAKIEQLKEGKVAS